MNILISITSSYWTISFECIPPNEHLLGYVLWFVIIFQRFVSFIASKNMCHFHHNLKSTDIIIKKHW